MYIVVRSVARLSVKLAFLDLLHFVRLVDFLIVVAVKVVRVLVVRHVFCLELGRERRCQSGLLSENRWLGESSPKALFISVTAHHT